MFRDVPECSGMFRDVPCSWFYRRPQISASWGIVLGVCVQNNETRLCAVKKKIVCFFFLSATFQTKRVRNIGHKHLLTVVDFPLFSLSPTNWIVHFATQLKAIIFHISWLIHLFCLALCLIAWSAVLLDPYSNCRTCEGRIAWESGRLHFCVADGVDTVEK